MSQKQRRGNLQSREARLPKKRIKPAYYLIITENRPAYAYLCKDLTTKRELEKKLIERAEDQNLSSEEIYDTMQS